MALCALARKDRDWDTEDKDMVINLFGIIVGIIQVKLIGPNAQFEGKKRWCIRQVCLNGSER